jgi:hypothetical protein
MELKFTLPPLKPSRRKDSLHFPSTAGYSNERAAQHVYPEPQFSSIKPDSVESFVNILPQV